MELKKYALIYIFKSDFETKNQLNF